MRIAFCAAGASVPASPPFCRDVVLAGLRPVARVTRLLPRAGLLLMLLPALAETSMATTPDHAAGRTGLRLETLAPSSTPRRLPVPPIRLAQSGPSFFQQLFGGGDAPKAPPSRRRPRFAAPGYVPQGYRDPRGYRPRRYSIYGGIFWAPRQAPRRSYPRRYRTMCVRTCDGYYFPISSSASRSELYRDAEKCQARCGQETTLFYQPSGDTSAKALVDLNGHRYEKMSYAFKYRKTFNAACRCRPQSWTDSELQRHSSYAEVETDKQFKTRKALEQASITPYLTPEQIALNEEKARKKIEARNLAADVLLYASGIDPFMKLAEASSFDLRKAPVPKQIAKIAESRAKPRRTRRRFPRRLVFGQRSYRMRPIRWYRSGMGRRLPVRRFPARRSLRPTSGRVYRIYR